jgi:hypothetical protein
LLKNKKGGTPLDILALTLFTINFFNLRQGDILTATDQHFGEPPPLPDIQIPIWYKSFNAWLPGPLLKKGKGYVCVSTDVHGSPKHYGFHFRVSGPAKAINMSKKVMTSSQRETPKDEQMEHAT